MLPQDLRPVAVPTKALPATVSGLSSVLRGYLGTDTAVHRVLLFLGIRCGPPGPLQSLKKERRHLQGEG